MARLTDPEILAKYMEALSNYAFKGYVRWKDTAEDWVSENLLETSLKQLTATMYEFVKAGGEIDQVRERRPEWNEHDYHYDLRIGIAGRLIYIETLLLCDPGDEPTINVVSIHDA